jgi:chromosome partitioning protein
MAGNKFTKSCKNIGHNYAKRIAFVHHKGGTGKTTACLNIAGWLTKLNQKVLVIDLDPQANATTGLGVDLKSIESSMYDVLLQQSTIHEIILETHSGVYLAPATVSLLSAEMELAKKPNAMNILENKLEEAGTYFNFILIDSPPGSSLLMINGILAAKDIIIPLDTGVFGFETLDTLKTLILTLEDDYDVSINIMMTLLKVFSPSLLRNGLTKKIRKMITHYFSINGLQACTIFDVPVSKKVCLAQMHGLPISHYAPNSTVSGVYQKIAKEILRYNKGENVNE